MVWTNNISGDQGQTFYDISVDTSKYDFLRFVVYQSSGDFSFVLVNDIPCQASGHSYLIHTGVSNAAGWYVTIYQRRVDFYVGKITIDNCEIGNLQGYSLNQNGLVPAKLYGIKTH